MNKTLLSLLCLLVLPLISAETIFEDTFTRANNPTLDNTETPGGAYSETGVDYDLDTGAIHINPQSSGNISAFASQSRSMSYTGGRVRLIYHPTTASNVMFLVNTDGQFVQIAAGSQAAPIPNPGIGFTWGQNLTMWENGVIQWTAAYGDPHTSTSLGADPTIYIEMNFIDDNTMNWTARGTSFDNPTIATRSGNILYFQVNTTTGTANGDVVSFAHSGSGLDADATLDNFLVESPALPTFPPVWDVELADESFTLVDILANPAERTANYTPNGTSVNLSLTGGSELSGVVNDAAGAIAFTFAPTTGGTYIYTVNITNGDGYDEFQVTYTVSDDRPCSELEGTAGYDSCITLASTAEGSSLLVAVWSQVLANALMKLIVVLIIAALLGLVIYVVRKEFKN